MASIPAHKEVTNTGVMLRPRGMEHDPSRDMQGDESNGMDQNESQELRHSGVYDIGTSAPTSRPIQSTQRSSWSHALVPTWFPWRSNTRREIDSVRMGEVVLAKGAFGEAVEEMQQLLEKNNFLLGQYGADGKFGEETAQKLELFQSMHGLPPHGRLDQATLTRLEAGAAQLTRYPEYEELFADGVFHQTIAVGYDEGGSHELEIMKLVEGLFQQNYEMVSMKRSSVTEVADYLSLDFDQVDRDSHYFVKVFDYRGNDVKAVVRLITPDVPQAQQKFAEALARGEVVMYAGPAQLPFSDVSVHTDENAARASKNYQLVFFNGCQNVAQINDLCARQPNDGSAKSLDVVATHATVYWNNTAQSLLAMSRGLTSAMSIDDIKVRLNEINQDATSTVTKNYVVNGFDGDSHLT